MKSLKESLGLARTGSIIEGMPRSAVGIVTHRDEEKLNKLWIDIIKCEEAYAKLSCETGKYCSAIKEIQSTEEKLLKLLGDSNIGVHSTTVREIIDEYLSANVELKRISEEASHAAHEAMAVAPSQYHSLFAPLDALRRRRDLLVGEAERCQEKLDRLKLKGKRTTDVTVERDRCHSQLREADARLRGEGEAFAALGADLLLACLGASVHSQMNYYGSNVAALNASMQTSRTSNRGSAADSVEAHLDAIQGLTIVD